MKRINTHIHSRYSDGKLLCSELMSELVKNKLNIVSLTDHNTMEGYPEFIKLCEKNKISLLPGVEISTYTQTYLEFIDEGGVNIIHILGYFPNSFSFSFINDVKELSNRKPKLKDTIDFIHHHQGLAVLAHPFDAIKETFNETIKKYMHEKVKMSEPLVRKIIEACKQMGIDGLEVYYEKNTEEELKILLEIAQTNHFITTMGTDYHRITDHLISKYNDINKYNFILNRKDI